LCCLELIGPESKATVSLTECAGDAGAPQMKDQAVGYEWPDEAPFGAQPFVQYEVLSSRHGIFLLRYLWSGGGTGYFSGLITVALEETRLTRRHHITGGDRCNGGLVEASVKGTVLSYAVQVTPFDMLQLTQAGKGLGLTAYEDLESSASSCFARARYRYDLPTGKESLVAVELNDAAAVDSAGWTEQYRHQSCFNRRYNHHLGQRLSPRQLSDFVEAFRQECLQP